MTEPKYAYMAARLLAKQRNAIAATVDEPADAAPHIAAMTAAFGIRARRRQAQRVVVGLGVFAVAASAILLWQTQRESQNEVAKVAPDSLSHGAAEVRAVNVVGNISLKTNLGVSALSANTLLSPGQRILGIAGGSAAVTLNTGTRIDLSQGADLALLEMGRSQRLLALSGISHYRVAKLPAGEHFVVGTQDAEVEVHGTVFSVEVLAAAESCLQARTRVIVEEGVVAVRHAGHETLLTRGQQWPNCEPAKTASPASDVESPPTVSHNPLAVRHNHRANAAIPAVVAKVQENEPEQTRVAVPVDENLREQNDLFAGATSLYRAAKVLEAAAKMKTLIDHFPNGPLLQSAYAKRMQWLDQEASPEAPAAAKEYLRQFPQGFARAQAKQILEDE